MNLKSPFPHSEERRFLWGLVAFLGARSSSRSNAREPGWPQPLSGLFLCDKPRHTNGPPSFPLAGRPRAGTKGGSGGVLTDTYIRQPTEPRDEPAVNLQISLRTAPPTARASAPSAHRAAKTARVAGAISHFAPVRLGKRPSSRAPSRSLVSIRCDRARCDRP
jgi:hypothetical protein